MNDSMGGYVAKQTVKKMRRRRHQPGRCPGADRRRHLQENVTDIRNSNRVADVVKERRASAATVDVVDPHADHER